MGPAILLCPSSAVQLLGQVAPSKTPKTKSLWPTNECSKHLLDVRRRGGLFGHSFPSNVGVKCSKINPPYAWRILSAAVGNEVSLEEPITEELDSTQAPEALVGATNGEEPTTQRRRNAPRQENRIITVNTADLIPGATFPGKVTSIQSFGAFVDIGTFTNGLVHISRLSKGYVKTVEDVVQVGQEVNVEILNVDLQANRISLMLKGEEREPEEARTNRPPRDPTQPTRGARRSDPGKRDAASKPTTKFKKGESLTGVVKNIIRSGVFFTLPDGTDGFLPAAEVNLRGANTTLESQFQLGQELTVRVQRIERGRVGLTMKQEVDLAKINKSLNKDLIGGATNPFVIAFRQNELISSYLAEKQKLQDAAESKVVEPESEAPAKDAEEEQSLTTAPEKEETEAPSDVEAVHLVSGAELEGAVGVNVQGDETSEDSSKELTDEKQADSQAVEDSEGKLVEAAAAKEVVDELPLTKLPEKEDTQVPTDVSSGAALQEAVEETVQDDMAPQNSSKEVIEKIPEESQALVVDEPIEVPSDVVESQDQLGEEAAEVVTDVESLHSASVEVAVEELVQGVVTSQDSTEELQDKVSVESQGLVREEDPQMPSDVEPLLSASGASLESVEEIAQTDVASEDSSEEVRDEVSVESQDLADAASQAFSKELVAEMEVESQDLIGEEAAVNTAVESTDEAEALKEVPDVVKEEEPVVVE